jgi:cytochrome c-type biogenesis protein CcmH
MPPQSHAHGCHPGISQREISGTQDRDGRACRPWVPALRASRSAGMTPLICAALLALLTSIAPVPAAAVEPGEMMQDPALEARARQISQELRCLVCQNQSIDDSNAELARDLRLLVRERLAAGDSDAAVLAFVEARYGEFVLLRPPFNARTLLLWLSPLALLAGTLIVLYRRARSAPPATVAPAPLSPAERQRLDALLKSDD